MYSTIHMHSSSQTIAIFLRGFGLHHRFGSRDVFLPFIFVFSIFFLWNGRKCQCILKLIAYKFRNGKIVMEKLVNLIYSKIFCRALWHASVMRPMKHIMSHQGDSFRIKLNWMVIELRCCRCRVLYPSQTSNYLVRILRFPDSRAYMNPSRQSDGFKFKNVYMQWYILDPILGWSEFQIQKLNWWVWDHRTLMPDLMVHQPATLTIFIS